MDTNENLTIENVVIGGLIVVGIIILAPIVIDTVFTIGAGVVNAAHKEFGKCYELTVRYEDGSEEKTLLTKRQAKKAGLI